MTLPVPVILNLFAAPLWVLSLSLIFFTLGNLSS